MNLRILAADWGKLPKKRAIYEALVAERCVRRVTPHDAVTDVEALLSYAASLSEPTLVAFDAPLGVPASFLAALGQASFPAWLLEARLDSCTNVNDWSCAAPFFQVPKGKGSLGTFHDAAAAQKTKLQRTIDVRTGAKSPFITAGIPGSVGSAARDLWRGLARARHAGLRFHLWPFEGDMGTLLARGGPVVGEMYPRALYATALKDEAPRSRLFVAKTDAETRRRAVHHLTETAWIAKHRVTLENLSEALASEDDFDAMIAAAALLRCAIEGLPFSAVEHHDPIAEGAILGTGTIDLSLRETKFGLRHR